MNERLGLSCSTVKLGDLELARLTAKISFAKVDVRTRRGALQVAGGVEADAVERVGMYCPSVRPW